MSLLTRSINCPACGRGFEEPRATWRGTVAVCPWCGLQLKQEVPWLRRFLPALAGMLIYSTLSAAKIFDGTWLRWGVRVAVLLAAAAILWRGERRLNSWRVLDDPRLRQSSSRRLALLLIGSAVLFSYSGLLLRGYDEGDTMPFSPPVVLAGVGEVLRNRMLRGPYDEGGAGVVDGVVVDAFHEGPVSVIVNSEGWNMTFANDGGSVLYSGPSKQLAMAAAKRLCQTAAGLLAHFRPFSRLLPGFPYPAPGQARFYVRANGGLMVADAALADLASPSHPLAPLWAAAERAREPTSGL